MTLVFDNKSWRYIRFGLGVLYIIAGTASFIASSNDLRVVNYILLFGFVTAGILSMTNDFGTNRTWFRIENNCLIVKLMSAFRPVQFHAEAIDFIYLQKSGITISPYKGKPLKINMTQFEVNQKRMIFEFFIKFSEEKQVRIKKDF